MIYFSKGNAGDSMAYHDGMKFSTYDRDNDIEKGNCASAWTGAWWYRKCHRVNLNARFPTTSTTSAAYMGWNKIYGNYGNIIFSEMKLKYHRYESGEHLVS